MTLAISSLVFSKSNDFNTNDKISVKTTDNRHFPDPHFINYCAHKNIKTYMAEKLLLKAKGMLVQNAEIILSDQIIILCIINKKNMLIVSVLQKTFRLFFGMKGK